MRPRPQKTNNATTEHGALPAPVAVATIDEAIEAYHPLVYRMAYRVLGNQADAEDATQEVFLRLFRQGSVERIRSLPGWLVRVTLNASRNMIRGHSNRRAREARWAADSEARQEEAHKMPHSESHPDEAHDPERLAAAIAALPDDLRLPLVLHYEEGLKYREIATALELREGTVAKRIHTAKARLQERLQRGGATAVAPLVAAQWLEQGLAASRSSIEVPATLATRLHAAIQSAQAAATTATTTGAAAKVGSHMAARVTRYCVVLAALAAVTVGGFMIHDRWQARDTKDTARATPAPAVPEPGPETAGASATPVSDDPAPAATTTTDTAADNAAPTAAKSPGGPTRPPAIHGVVRTSQLVPIADATVELLDGSGDSVVATTQTDADGKYAFYQIPVDEFGESLPTFGLGGGAGGRRVMGGVGLSRTSKEETTDSSADATTDDSAPSKPKSYVRLHATAARHVPYKTTGFVVVEGKSEEVNFELEPGQMLRGVVRSAAGYPIPDATVAIIGFEGGDGPRDAAATTTTDAQGEFAYDMLADRSYLIHATASDYLPESTIARVGTRRNDIVLESAGRIEVALTDPVGDDNVELRLQEKAVSDSRFLQYGHTTSNGQHTFESVAPGEYTVHVYRASFPLVSEDVRVSADASQRLAIDVRVGCTISGHITLPGPPADERALRVIVAPIHQAKKSAAERAYQQAPVDAGNNFVLRHLPPGKYLLMVYPEKRNRDNVLAYREFNIAATATELEVDIEVDEGVHGSVLAEILPNADGKTPPYLHAVLRHPIAHRYVASVFITKGREVQLTAPPGEYTLALGSPGYMTQLQDVTVRTGQELIVKTTIPPRADDTRPPLSEYFPEDFLVTLSKPTRLRTYIAWLAQHSNGGIEIAESVQASGILERPTRATFPNVEHSLPQLLRRHGLDYEAAPRGGLRIIRKAKHTEP